jgi:hypothetical protein
MKYPPNDLATELSTGERPMFDEDVEFDDGEPIPVSMEIKMLVNGVERTYKGDYFTLHNNDWNDIVREQLDRAYSEETI